MKKAAGTILLVVGLLVVGFIIVGLCLAVLIIRAENRNPREAHSMPDCWNYPVFMREALRVINFDVLWGCKPKPPEFPSGAILGLDRWA
jgi:hypothetical protein